MNERQGKQTLEMTYKYCHNGTNFKNYTYYIQGDERQH